MFEIITKTDQKGYYTIVAPSTIQSDYDYKVTITLHNRTEPATIKIAITGPSYNKNKTVEVQPFVTEIVHFEIPTIEDGAYELQTEGIKGLSFKESSKLTYKNEKPKVYIQTDKATYKPGDLVQYRILALDENTRPAKLKQPLNLSIQDGAFNRIKQINDLQFDRGVYTGKFQLSEQPILGSWIIDITEGKENKSKINKSFEVAKYVLPKFSVEIETDKEVAVLDKVVKITVRSKYTYGKSVKGKAKITAKFDSHSDDAPSVEKTIDIDGKCDVEFDLMDDLQMDQYAGYTPQISVEAVMTEAFTGLEQSTTTTINVVNSRYTVTLPIMNYVYEVNKTFEIKAVIKKLNGLPVTNAKSTAKLMISASGGQSLFGRGCGFNNFGGKELMFEGAIDQNGVATFKLKLSKAAIYSNLKILYEEMIHTEYGFRLETENDKAKQDMCAPAQIQHIGHLKMFLKTTEPKLGEEFTIDVKSENPLPYFIYTIMARSKILKHEYVKVEENTKCHSIQLKATFDMVPTANIFVYFVKDGELRFDTTTINLPNTFENKLEILAPEESQPSEEISLNIKTDPDSYVGLLGVDQSVLLLQSGNDFDENSIFNDLRSYEASPSRDGRDMPGRGSGFITLTNAKYPRHPPMMTRCFGGGMAFGGAAMAQSAMFGAAPANLMAAPEMRRCKAAPVSAPVVQPKVRKNFVETWIFDDIESTDSNGMATITKKIPDTITSWVITGFSLNESTGFGMSLDPTKIRVFQPFFLSTNLPYSIKRGEVITIPVVIFNYMETTLDGIITLENTDNEFEFIESDTDIAEDNQMTKKISVASNNGETVAFTIKANIVGEIMLKIKAITPVAGDAMHQKLKVEPEGVTQYENLAYFVTIPNGGSLKQAFKAEIPSDVVLDSEYLEFSAVGDILGPTIKNIDKLVRMPFGCGEQNMINFVPNILVLQYLDVIKADMPSIAQKAKSYMETGYQRELTYKHKDGSYSAFGEGSSESNSWLTAYVARSFIQARKHITVDENLIEKALEYLIKTQKDNGQFPQTGKLFHSSNQNDVGVSAFILLAFLEDMGYATKYKTQIYKSLQYLVECVDKEDNVYTLALIALIFHKAQHPATVKLMERLEQKSTNENNLKWWSNSLKYNDNNIEVTAYIFQSLIETQEPGKLLPIIKWLIGQRNSLGGFDSTQDTVVGLQALIKFAEIYAAGGDGKMSIQFEAQDGAGEEMTTGSFDMDKENALLLQSHVLPKSTRQIVMCADGVGSSLVQFSYRYNLAKQDDEPSFAIKQTPKKPLFPNQLLMNISAEFLAHTDSETKESNMAVMEISFPSGYTTDNDSLQTIRDARRVQRVETKNEETVIVVYFDSLVAGEAIAFDVAAEKSHEVAELKPAPITIYDYYNTKQRATLYYECKN